MTVTTQFEVYNAELGGCDVINYIPAPVTLTLISDVLWEAIIMRQKLY